VQAHASKEPIAPGDETNNGNFLIPDIAGPETVPHALIDGLGDNTSRRQVGIALKFNRHYGHGYRFTFHKTSHSRALAGDVEGVWSYTVTGIRLDIEPVSQSLRDPKSALPGDLADAPSSTRPALEAIWFRGILTADDQNRFRPGDAISRGELASAVAQTICLSPPRESLPIADVDAASPLADDVARVVKAGIMPLTPEGAFKPSRPVDPQTARAIFTRLCELYRGEKPSLPPFESEHITRTETAVALYKIIGFPW
jgi:hypothetical protein